MIIVYSEYFRPYGCVRQRRCLGQNRIDQAFGYCKVIICQQVLVAAGRAVVDKGADIQRDVEHTGGGVGPPLNRL